MDLAQTSARGRHQGPASLPRSRPLRAQLAAALMGLCAITLAEPTRAEAPLGIWELAGGHVLPVKAEVAFAAGGVLVVSDRHSRVVGVRPDSGLTVWSRELSGEHAAIFRLETSHTPDGAIVVVADTVLRGYRADVGTRLWELPLRCEGAVCAERVVYAGPVTTRGGPSRPDLRVDVLLVARGGAVQSEVARVDPRTGRTMWTAPAVHPRRALVAPTFVAVEEAIAPFGVVFLDPADGKVLGRFERKAGIPRPLGELAVQGEALVAVDLRPGDGGLANVVVLDTTGRVVTERQVARPAALSGGEQLPVEAHPIEAGLAVFTPVPSAQKAVFSVIRMAPPWTVRTEVVEARGAAVRFGGEAAWLTSAADRQVAVTVVHASRAEAKVGGFAEAPTAIVPLGASLLVAGPVARDGASIVTVDSRGRLAFGAPDLSAPVVDAALVDQDLVLVTRAGGKDRLERLVLVDWAVALTRLKAAHERGADISTLVGRLSRFYPVADALGDDVAVPRLGELGAADRNLLAALRDAWRSGDALGTLDGVRDLIEREPERSERRLALVQAASELVLDMVLAVGGAVRPEVAERLVALTRIAEYEAQRCARADCEVSRAAFAIFAATMALVDEPLAGADLLARAPAAVEGAEARLELGRRALHLLRKSAGTLRTDTSRQMLVSGLRFFLHFDGVLAERAAEASALMDAATHDASAAQRLDALLTEAEGAAARKKGSGAGLCKMACEATQALCGEARSKVAACLDRCVKSGAVRLSTGARPTSDPRWFCR